LFKCTEVISHASAYIVVIGHRLSSDVGGLVPSDVRSLFSTLLYGALKRRPIQHSQSSAGFEAPAHSLAGSSIFLHSLWPVIHWSYGEAADSRAARLSDG
jgi:hypothetical protein